MKLKILLLVALSLALLSCKWAEPENIGVRDGELHGCPASPNCVSSFAEQGSKYAAPILINPDLDQQQAMSIAKETLLAMPNVKLRREKDNYLWLEFSTKVGFVDDVELLYDPERHRFYVRSASRMGYYDFRVNRKRYDMIKNKLQGAFDENTEKADFSNMDDTSANDS